MPQELAEIRVNCGLLMSQTAALKRDSQRRRWAAIGRFKPGKPRGKLAGRRGSWSVKSSMVHQTVQAWVAGAERSEGKQARVVLQALGNHPQYKV